MGFVHEVLALVLPRSAVHRSRTLGALSVASDGWLIQQAVGLLNGGLVAGMGAVGLETFVLTDGAYRAAMIGGGLTFALVVACGVNRRYGVDRASRVVALSSGEFMELTVPKSRIVSARPFDIALYEERVAQRPQASAWPHHRSSVRLLGPVPERGTDSISDVSGVKAASFDACCGSVAMRVASNQRGPSPNRTLFPRPAAL